MALHALVTVTTDNRSAGWGSLSPWKQTNDVVAVEWPVAMVTHLRNSGRCRCGSIPDRHPARWWQCLYQWCLSSTQGSREGPASAATTMSVCLATGQDRWSEMVREDINSLIWVWACVCLCVCPFLHGYSIWHRIPNCKPFMISIINNANNHDSQYPL